MGVRLEGKAFVFEEESGFTEGPFGAPSLILALGVGAFGKAIGLGKPPFGGGRMRGGRTRGNGLGRVIGTELEVFGFPDDAGGNSVVLAGENADGGGNPNEEAGGRGPLAAENEPGAAVLGFLD